MSTRTVQRPACDRCHSIKGKCSRAILDGTPSASCDRCKRLGYLCSTTRQILTAGRPRKPERASTQPQAAVEFVWPASSSSDPEDSPRDDTTERRDHAEEQTVQAPLSVLRPWDPRFVRMPPRDQMLLNIMFDKTTYIHHFLLSPRYADEVLGNLFISLNESPDSVLSIYLACSGRFAKRLRLDSSPDADADYVNSARAVRTLRRAVDSPSLTKADLLAAIILGLGLITFDLMDNGMHAHSVSRCTLGIVDQHCRLWSRGDEIFRELAPALLPLATLDMFNCLLHRRLPVLKLPATNTAATDRYIGLCVPLFAHLHDICYLSHKLASLPAVEQKAPGTPESDRRQTIYAKLDVIEADLQLWQPLFPDTFSSSSTAQDMVIMSDQAEAHRYALLLVIHRLRHPLNREDQGARTLSRVILGRIKRMYDVSASSRGDASPSHSGLQLDYRLAFPFMVAAVELTTPDERKLSLERLGMVVSRELYENVAHTMKRALIHIWAVRDQGTVIHWLDVVSEGPPFVLF